MCPFSTKRLFKFHKKPPKGVILNLIQEWITPRKRSATRVEETTQHTTPKELNYYVVHVQ